MPDVLVRDVESGLLDALKTRAKQNGRSLQGEVLFSIRQSVNAGPLPDAEYDWTYPALAIALSRPFITADEKFYQALEPMPLKAHLIWPGDIP